MDKAKKYNHSAVEKKWQKVWETERLYSPDLSSSDTKRKFYNLWMFPYPSGEGLHAGHAFASTGSDVFGRFARMKGNTVFQPIGYDSFGIHSENFAIKTGEHPTKMLERTTANYEKQLRSLGLGFDWSRTVTTSDVDYYRWTQWIFTQMFKAGLAYRKKASVNWCPSCKTVLADEQVVTPKQAGKEPKNIDGSPVADPENAQVCERCGTVVEKKDLAQWFFRITDYADRLLDNLDKIDWSERVVTAQRNWIGKKEGVNINYELKTKNEKLKGKSITCWTSRPDTNFGATFIVVSPEYAKTNLIDLIPQEYVKKVKRYITISLEKSQESRQQVDRKKTGALTGLYAVNSLNGYEMPIYVADFVLSGVGTGAVVGVPAHDKRDFEFAKEFKIPIKRVVVASDGDKSEITKLNQVQEKEGKMINSDFLNGLDIHEATQKMMDHLEKKGWGERTTNYHLRDWLISRQRYWGPPIPMIFCSECESESKGWIGSNENKKWLEQSKFKFKSKTNIRNTADWSSAGWFPVPDTDLPVELPNIKDYKPKGTGRGPLDDHPEFYEVKCPNCGGDAKRETDVSDTFLDSAWYFLRYPSVNLQFTKSNFQSNSNSKINKLNNSLKNENSKIDNLPWSPEVTKTWLPVDLYFGGAEHSVLHLMYARFVTMVMHDLGHTEFEEPFPKFYAHGLMIKDGAKMSKSKGNVVNPDKYIEKFGADTLRLYLMFMGPMDGYPDFRDTGIEGMRRFIEKVWGLFESYKEQVPSNKQISNFKSKVQKSNEKWQMKNDRSTEVAMHKTIKKVTEDIERYHYNTAIAALMEYVNALRVQIPIAKFQLPNSDSKRKMETGKSKLDIDWRNHLVTLAKLIAPFAPHLSEEVWQEVLGQKGSVHTAKWPLFDAKLLAEDVVEIAVQVNGKLRATVEVDKTKSSDKTFVTELATKDQKVSKWISGGKIKKEIFVPGRLINFVV